MKGRDSKTVQRREEALSAISFLKGMAAGAREGFYSTFQNRWQGGRRREKLFSLLSVKAGSYARG